MSELDELIELEQNRQNNTIELIASENFTSNRVKSIVGSCLTNKYAEGYPNKESIENFKAQHCDYIHTGNIGRYYGGCQNIDQIELYCRYMWQKAFGVDREDNLYHVNVQPHSGSQANMAAFAAVLKPGDTILAMSLDNGGHLTHGSKANFSGKLYDSVFYSVRPDGYIDYDDFYNKITILRPNLIIAGASAYPREIDFKYMHTLIEKAKGVCDNYNPYFMVDMAHIAGLVATGEHVSPFGYADIITTTTHKTLRGPRGALIFCKPELAKKIDSAVFPGTQGGPLMHVIAGKAAAAEEVLSDGYKKYIHQVVLNCKAMCDEFKKLGYSIITGGTDNHLFLIDLSPFGLNGKEVQDLLDRYGITVNKNCIPNETLSPMLTSGIRVGTAAVTTIGFNEEDCIRVADEIDKVIKLYKESQGK